MNTRPTPHIHVHSLSDGRSGKSSPCEKGGVGGGVSTPLFITTYFSATEPDVNGFPLITVRRSSGFSCIRININ